MQGEESRHRRARPKPSRHAAQEDKEQDSIGHVQEQVRQVMAGGIEAEEVHIDLDQELLKGDDSRKKPRTKSASPFELSDSNLELPRHSKDTAASRSVEERKVGILDQRRKIPPAAQAMLECVGHYSKS